MAWKKKTKPVEKTEAVEEIKPPVKPEVVEKVEEGEMSEKRYVVKEYATQTNQIIEDQETGKTMDVYQALEDLMNKVDEIYEAIVGTDAK